MKLNSIRLEFFRVAHWVADGEPYEMVPCSLLEWLPCGSFFCLGELELGLKVRLMSIFEEPRTKGMVLSIVPGDVLK